MVTNWYKRWIIEVSNMVDNLQLTNDQGYKIASKSNWWWIMVLNSNVKKTKQTSDDINIRFYCQKQKIPIDLYILSETCVV